jgi:flagellar export protein FliJ
MTPPKTDAWSLLVDKARRALEACQQQLAQAQARRDQLKASEQRVHAMIIEYRRRQDASASAGQLMADRLNERQFIAQLQQLQDQAVRASRQADLQCRQLGQSVAAARQALEKAEKVRDQFQAQARAERERREQKRQDEMAVMRYQWQHP